MRWELKWSDSREYLEDREAEELDFEAPALRSRPKLPPDLAAYVEAFFILSPGRSAGMGAVSGIPFADIEAYLRVFPCWNPARFVRYMRACDAEYLAFHQKRK